MIRLCFFRVTDQRIRSWETVWTHGSQIGICIQGVNAASSLQPDLGKHLDGFKVGYSVFCNVALGGWSTSEWETYGLHFCCDHMWVLKGKKMRTPALKESNFTTDSHNSVLPWVTLGSPHLPKFRTVWLDNRPCQCVPALLKRLGQGDNCGQPSYILTLLWVK